MEYSDKQKHLNANPLENNPSASDSLKGRKTSAGEPPASGKEKPSSHNAGKGKQQEVDQEEQVNYALLSKEDLVKLFEEKLNEESFDRIRSIAEEIQRIYEEKLEGEMEEKKRKFMNEGGQELDFKPVEEPVDRKMSELIDKYKGLKADFNKQLEDEKEANLAAKEGLLEEFRLLMEKPEAFDHTFRKFKQLQKQWFSIGIVPKQHVRDLWNSYNFFVDKFNDYVNINKELRVLDLKKNREKKEALCEKAEALADESNISKAFKALQGLHAQWREIGPVPREEKDAVWQRFKAATLVINKAHQRFQAELKGALDENLQKKTTLCEKAEVIAESDPKDHKAWQGKTNELLSLQKEWKSIGYAPKKENNKVYARFRKACDIFFEKKAGFYAESQEHQKESLEEKRVIVEEAEKLSESKEWKKTTDKLIALQKRWKESGPVPRKESDKLWKRFRAACDQFFHAKSDFFSGKDESYTENQEKKEALIRELLEFRPPEDRTAMIRALEAFQERYNEIGFVPVEEKDRIRDEFKDALASVIDRSEADKNEKSLIRYRLKVMAILSGPKGDQKLNFERDRLMNKLQQLRNDIGVWENNIGFFKQTESAEDTIAEFQEKIDGAHMRIELLENKIKTIDELTTE